MSFNVSVKVQKVNGWKATLGGVHLQKIENQVKKYFLSNGDALAPLVVDFTFFSSVSLIISLITPQCLEVLSRLEYPLLGQGVAGVKQ